MKIELLSLCNLNSLSDKWDIPFNREPFNGSGLFAITGPTGAGKSTIFDAICLALFGRTPRLKNPDEIMTRHKADCFAELTYSVNGNTYRSRWEQRRSRGKSDGNLQNAKMSVVQINDSDEKILEEKKSLVPGVNASITGLDYDQFTRSILLAQGNFASFLKAGPNERAELLEKMTGSELYTKLSIEAFNRARDEEDKLSRLREKAGDTEVMEGLQREALTVELEELQSAKEAAEKQRQENIALKNWLDQEIILKHRIDNAKFELDAALEKEKDSSRLEDEYIKRSSILSNVPLYESWVFLKNEIVRLDKENTDLTVRKDSTSIQIETLEKTIDSLRNKIALDRDKADILTEKVQALDLLENTLSTSEKHIREQKEILKSKNENLEREKIQRGSILNELKSSQSRLKELQKYIEKNINHRNINESLPLLRDLHRRLDDDNKSITEESLKKANNSSAELHKKISLIENENPGAKENYKNIKELLLKMAPVSRQFQEVDKNNKKNIEDKNTYTSELALVAGDIQKLRSELDKINSLSAEFELNNLAHEIKTHLHDGDTCPVCQGIFRQSENQTQNNNQSTIGIDKETLKKTESELQKKESRKLVLSQLIQNTEVDGKKNSETLQELLSEWDNLKGNMFSGLHPLDRSEANRIFVDCESKIQDCSNWETELEALKEEERKLNEKIERLKQSVQIKQQIETILTKYEINSGTGVKSLSQLENLYTKYSTTEREVEDLNRLIHTLENKSVLIQEKEDNFNKDINDLIVNIRRSEEDYKQLEGEQFNLSDGKSREQLGNEIQILKTSGEQQLELKRNELISSRENLSSIRGTLDKNLKDLPILKKNYEEKNLVIEKLLDENNLNISDFSQNDLKDTVEKLKRELDLLRENKIRTEEAYNNAAASLEEHSRTTPENADPATVDRELVVAGQLIEESSRNIGIIEEKLRRDNIIRKQLQELTNKIEGQEKESYKWSRMRTLIGSADGKSYRRFVQGLTLEKLVILANTHLERLNNRYRIVRSQKKELELEIVDSWQADTIRPATTLSGGESFLVSLALSLGLSELVGNKVVIDSLFLDEGFGTLDPDSLETVLAALETLQSSGKLIGIISHVAAIRERIAVQIRVKKIAGGRSTIEIV